MRFSQKTWESCLPLSPSAPAGLPCLPPGGPPGRSLLCTGRAACMHPSRALHSVSEVGTFTSVPYSPPPPHWPLHPSRQDRVLVLARSTAAGTQEGRDMCLWSYKELEAFYQGLFCTEPDARQSFKARFLRACVSHPCSELVGGEARVNPLHPSPQGGRVRWRKW